MLYLIIFIIAVALGFDFLNGFHDAANSIATIVSTRVLTPIQAVIWAAFFNFVAAFVFGTPVAKMISSGIIHEGRLTETVILAGLIGAIVWNIITWLLALPTSSSHALLSGLAGAAVAAFGSSHTLIASGWYKILLFLVLSPIIGLVLGATNMIAVSWIFRNSTPRKVDSLFRRLQLVSAGFYSLGHGANDAQKTMGVIVGLLAANYSHYAFRGGVASTGIAWWIILSCQAAIALGTMTGGWRIVKTMGSGITRLQPIGGCCAEMAGATTIIGTALMGIPISTTHAITGAILGVGMTRGTRSVRWIWGQRIVLAWILTMPCASFVAAVAYFILMLIHKMV